MKKVIGLLLAIYFHSSALAQCTPPKIQLSSRVYCQDKGSAKLDSSVIKPKTKFGTNQKWRILSAPGGIDTSGLVVDESGGYGLDWVLYFGDPTQDYYAGEYALEFTVTDQVTGCFAVDTTKVTIVTEPKVKISPPDRICLNADTLDLRTYVKLDNATPVINAYNKFTILEYRNSRVDPKVRNTILNHGYEFTPSSGAGVWLIKFGSNETGCLKEDSFYLDVADTPDAVLKAPITICSSSPPLDLSSRISQLWPYNATTIWSGWNVNNGFFTPTSKYQSILEGPYALRLKVIDGNGCSAAIPYYVTVETQPSLELDPGYPKAICEGVPVTLNVVSKFSSYGVDWQLLNNSDGNIQADVRNYAFLTPGKGDANLGYVQVKVSVNPLQNEACPLPSDTFTIVVHPFPKLVMGPAVTGCAPLYASFTVTDSSGIPDSTLLWHWNFGGQDSSDLKEPKNILIPDAGKYRVKVTATNGICATSVEMQDYLLVYPRPNASFATDPASRTIDEQATFQMINNSSLDQTFFSGSMYALWKFDDPATTPKDTSTAWEPEWTYNSDTGEHNITLVVVSDQGCQDTAVHAVKIITQGPEPLFPNAFTPDGKGPAQNEVFKPVSMFLGNYRLSVISRNGDVLFITDNYAIGWDGAVNGKPAPSGLYYYKAEYTTRTGEKKKYKGEVFLLR